MKFGGGAKQIFTLFGGDVPIEMDSEPAKQLGFTSERFEGWLWKHGKYIYVSYIVSRQEGKGNLSRLFKRIQSFGFGIKVPIPFPKMEMILRSHGFKHTLEDFKEAKAPNVEVWVLEPRTVKL